MIALLTSSVGIELLSSSARVTSVKSAKGGTVSWRDWDPQIDQLVSNQIWPQQIGKMCEGGQANLDLNRSSEK